MADIITTIKNRSGDTLYPIAGGMIDDSITTAMLKDNVVSTAKITNLAVTTNKIADSAVTTGKLADKAVTPAKIDTVESATAAVNTQYSNTTKRTHIPDLSFLSFWDGSYNGTDSNIKRLASNAVNTTNITDLNVTTAKIANSAVTPAKTSGFDTVLYNNATGSNGTITLSASAANYNYLKIFYRDNDSAYSSVDVYSPNGKRVCLQTVAATAGASTLYIKLRHISISGTTISTNGTQYAEITLTTGPGISNAANNRIYITRVVGSYYA